MDPSQCQNRWANHREKVAKKAEIQPPTTLLTIAHPHLSLLLNTSFHRLVSLIHSHLFSRLLSCPTNTSIDLFQPPGTAVTTTYPPLTIPSLSSFSSYPTFISSHISLYLTCLSPPLTISHHFSRCAEASYPLTISLTALLSTLTTAITCDAISRHRLNPHSSGHISPSLTSSQSRQHLPEPPP